MLQSRWSKCGILAVVVNQSTKNDRNYCAHCEHVSLLSRLGTVRKWPERVSQVASLHGLDSGNHNAHLRLLFDMAASEHTAMVLSRFAATGNEEVVCEYEDLLKDESVSFDLPVETAISACRHCERDDQLFRGQKWWVLLALFRPSYSGVDELLQIIAQRKFHNSLLQSITAELCSHKSDDCSRSNALRILEVMMQSSANLAPTIETMASSFQEIFLYLSNEINGTQCSQKVKDQLYRLFFWAIPSAQSAGRHLVMRTKAFVEAHGLQMIINFRGVASKYPNETTRCFGPVIPIVVFPLKALQMVLANAICMPGRRLKPLNLMPVLTWIIWHKQQRFCIVCLQRI